MAVQRKEYMLSVDNLSKPKVLEGREAVATLLIRLLLLNPGSDPLHPEMGVGLEDFRYCVGRIDELENRVKEQMEMYLPEFSYADVQVVEYTADKICNIEITIGDTVYVYDSTVMPIQITLDTYKMY